MTQVIDAQNITLAQWWDKVYPYALTLEKSITTAPSELPYWEVESINESLPHILLNIRQFPYPHCAALMREHLIKALTYLIHAFQELGNQNDNEVEFYYSSALTQLAQLHHQLVQHGFAS